MESLEERLENRYKNYRLLILAERMVEDTLKRLIPLLPDSADIQGTIYTSNAFLYASIDSVEEFEERTISEISAVFNIKWERDVSETQIHHNTTLVLGAGEDGRFDIYLQVTSKPTDNCRIIKVLTGETKKVCKTVYVEEAEFETLIECSDNNDEQGPTDDTNPKEGR